MKIKKENGLAGTDVVIAVVVIMLFSTLIIALIYNNFMENVKLKREALAMIYITEIFENVGIANYEDLKNGNYIDIENNSYSDNIKNLIPLDMVGGYNVNLVITNDLQNVENNENILKKIVVTLTYRINNKKYSCSMERMKIKE